MAEILKGAPAAAALDEKTIALVEELKGKGVTPTLAILRVGEDDSAVSYERGALKRCDKVGVAVKQVILPADVSQEELIGSIEALNEDDSVHGILMFRPLPKTLDEQAACAALDPRKDVDGITAGSSARIYSGSGDGFAPCTAQSCMEILRHYGVDPAGKHAVVIGRSLVIGRPVAMLLMAANATVTVCHSKTVNLPEITRSADIVVAAAGKAEAIGTEHFREGQTVLDVGINWSDAKNKLVGDVDFENVEPIVAAITPVPAGVGSVTTAVLVSHTAEAAARFVE